MLKRDRERKAEGTEKAAERPASETVVQAEEKALTVAQVADMLQVSEVTVYALMKKGAIPFTYVTPRLRRVLREDVRRFLGART